MFWDPGGAMIQEPKPPLGHLCPSRAKWFGWQGTFGGAFAPSGTKVRTGKPLSRQKARESQRRAKRMDAWLQPQLSQARSRQQDEPPPSPPPERPLPSPSPQTQTSTHPHRHTCLATRKVALSWSRATGDSEGDAPSPRRRWPGYASGSPAENRGPRATRLGRAAPLAPSYSPR